MTRAVATSNWSAGSRWKGCGSWVDSTTIRGSRCTSVTPGSARALSIQSPTARSSFSLPYSTSFATSQQETMLTPKTRSTPSSRRSRCLDCSRSGRETHQTQMWVSSRITSGRPSPRWQQAPTAHETREPTLEGFCSRVPLNPRSSRPPIRQPVGRARMGGPPKQVCHARRLSSLSSVLARPHYRGSSSIAGRRYPAPECVSGLEAERQAFNCSGGSPAEISASQWKSPPALGIVLPVRFPPTPAQGKSAGARRATLSQPLLVHPGCGCGRLMS